MATVVTGLSQAQLFGCSTFPQICSSIQALELAWAGFLGFLGWSIPPSHKIAWGEHWVVVIFTYSVLFEAQVLIIMLCLPEGKLAGGNLQVC